MPRGLMVRSPQAKTKLTLLMMAVTLLGSIVPPAHRHAHADPHSNNHDCDHHAQFHQHASSRHHIASHSHSHHSHDANHRHANERPGLGDCTNSLLAPPAIAHLHLDLWFIDFTLPLPENSEPQDEGPVYVVRLIHDALPTSLARFELPTPSSAVVTQPAEALPTLAVRTGCPAFVPRSLLCDTALRKCSGGLQI